MRTAVKAFRGRGARSVAVLLIGILVVFAARTSTTAQWRTGDVFVGVGDPYKYKWLGANGTAPSRSARDAMGRILLYGGDGAPRQAELFEPDGWHTTGCAYNPRDGRLWTTSFDSLNVNVYDGTTWARRIDVSQHADGAVESIAFAADGSVFVAAPWSTSPGQLLRYTADGSFVGAYALPAGGADWIDVRDEGGDTVVYYTAESKEDWSDGRGAAVHRFNVASGTGSPVGWIEDEKAFGLRLLPNDQGVLVAGTSRVFWLSLSGQVLRTYHLPGVLNFFTINIAPDGQHFWTGTAPDYDPPGWARGAIYKIHVPSGRVVAYAEPPYASVVGLCVVREYTAASNVCDTAGGTCRRLEICTGSPTQNDDGDEFVSDTVDPDCAQQGPGNASGNRAPVCEAAAPSVARLWPADGRMAEVRIDGVTDPDGTPPWIAITRIEQDEPIQAPRNGETPRDGDFRGGRAFLRAERATAPATLADGRVYEIFFTATDGQQSCAGSTTVGVPRDGSGATAVQGPIRYNSLTGLRITP